MKWNWFKKAKKPKTESFLDKEITRVFRILEKDAYFTGNNDLKAVIEGMKNINREIEKHQIIEKLD